LQIRQNLPYPIDLIYPGLSAGLAIGVNRICERISKRVANGVDTRQVNQQSAALKAKSPNVATQATCCWENTGNTVASIDFVELDENQEQSDKFRPNMENFMATLSGLRKGQYCQKSKGLKCKVNGITRVDDGRAALSI